ncbi:Aste57867_7459 [Aphanomyces stellatus]|uniref:Aste57867_7459 protein n=1 Tax=Aphanomyces stellatus TaxID=120398 RepID=A0A485KIC0_9STRA|nr:hypothetical protein As57867_007433 [Aphanomyces stellatus]VFT84371.1 Aste57867_7459 [Aphanomyces stellatus]
MSKGAVEDESGWYVIVSSPIDDGVSRARIVVTPVDDRSCWLSLVLHMRIDPRTFPQTRPPFLPTLASTDSDDDASIHSIATAINRLTMEVRAPSVGLLPEVQDRAMLGINLPLYKSFFDRGHEFEISLKGAVNDAVHAFQARARAASVRNR